MDIDFKGYWSQLDKDLWRYIDWAARDYKDYPIDDVIHRKAYFYGNNQSEERFIDFIRVIRSNPIYPPYYKPVMTYELQKFIEDGNYVGPMYDGRAEGNYDIHDRYETQELYDMLSD